MDDVGSISACISQPPNFCDCVQAPIWPGAYNCCVKRQVDGGSSIMSVKDKDKYVFSNDIIMAHSIEALGLIMDL